MQITGNDVAFRKARLSRAVPFTKHRPHMVRFARGTIQRFLARAAARRLAPNPIRLGLSMAALLCGTAAAQQIEFGTIQREALEALLKDCPFQNGKRHQKLLEVFAKAGCSGEALMEQKVRSSRYPNVICTAPGETDNVIVVGAHYDAAQGSYGVSDNWSGAMMLAELYQSLGIRPRRHTLIFIGFTAEEEGLIGSREYAKGLSPEQRQKIRAMVNLDTLGLSPTAFWLSKADPRLTQMLANVAAGLELPLNAVNVDRVGNTDAKSFIDIGVPTITIHSLTDETFRYLHTASDRIDKIRWDDYAQTGQLVAAFLAYLDTALETMPQSEVP